MHFSKTTPIMYVWDMKRIQKIFFRRKEKAFKAKNYTITISYQISCRRKTDGILFGCSRDFGFAFFSREDAETYAAHTSSPRNICNGSPIRLPSTRCTRIAYLRRKVFRISRHNIPSRAKCRNSESIFHASMRFIRTLRSYN